MKNTLVKNIAAIALIGCIVIFLGCNSTFNNILMEYYESNRANTANIFFAQESGGFYLTPKDILPQDYDARKREWYIQTIENTSYISKQYEDLLNGKNIITFARVVAKDNINIGVIGIDKFID
jgi:methyl-accepting chemotaxis protein